MGILTRAVAAPFIWAGGVRTEIRNSIEENEAKWKRLRLTDGLGWRWLNGRENFAKENVNFNSAMQLATAWDCIRKTSQAVSCLPLFFYRREKNDSRERVDNDPIAEVLTESPNEDQTPLEFWESMVAWMVTEGNAYALKIMDKGRLVALQPIMSTKCSPKRDENNVLRYDVVDRGQTETYPRDKIFHIKGFGQNLWNLDLGLSPIAAGANSLGSAMAGERAAAEMLSRGMMASGFVKIPQVLKGPQREQAHQLLRGYGGAKNAGQWLPLEAGWEPEAIDLNAADAELLASRKFSIEEICRWWGVPPIIVGHAAEGQTMWGTGVEQIFLAWLALGIDPVCDRIEARIKKQLIRPTGEKRIYAEFNREALLQMDSQAKAAFLSTMTQNGLMDRNEGRSKLNLPRRDGADELTAQSNLAPLTSLGAAAANDGEQARNAIMKWLGVDLKQGKAHEKA